MGEPIPAKIEIGGKIPKELLPKLTELIEYHALGFEWGTAANNDRIRKAFQNADKMCQPIEFTDDSARYGAFPELEDFLTKRGIIWRRHSDARYEFNAELVMNWPDRGVKRVAMCSDQDGNVVFPLQDLKQLVDRKIQEIVSQYEIFEKPLPPVQLV